MLKEVMKYQQEIMNLREECCTLYSNHLNQGGPNTGRNKTTLKDVLLNYIKQQ